MKLCELNLRAFGCFQNKLMRFDPSKPLQILYGENEAGKTTFSRAFLSLLYGFEKQSEKESPFLEGLFLSDQRDYIRVVQEKKNVKKLPTSLRAYFPDISREVFLHRFILNHETLIKGAENLLKFMGQFHLEFLESKGLITLKKVMNQIIEKKEQLYKPKGKKPILNNGYARYQVQNEENEKLKLKVEDYEKKIEEQNKLLSERKALEIQIEALRNSLERISNQESWIEESFSLSKLEAELLELNKEFDKQNASFFYTLKDPTQLWLNLKNELNHFQENEHLKKELEDSLEKLYENHHALQEETHLLSSEQDVRTLAEKFSALEKGYRAFLESESLFLELKHQETMIAKFARELAITEDIKDYLASEDLEFKFDLYALEKKYQEIKAKWNAFEKESKKTQQELSQLQVEQNELKFSSSHLETFYDTQARRKELEVKYQKEKEKLDLRLFIEEYFALVAREESQVEAILKEAEAVAKCQKNQWLLSKTQEKMAELSRQEKKLLEERQKLEESMKSFSLSKTFTFHEFGLFRLFIERLQRLLERIKAYHLQRAREKELLEKVLLFKKDIKELLKEAKLRPSSDLKESFCSLKDYQNLKEKEFQKQQELFLKMKLNNERIVENKERLKKVVVEQDNLYLKIKKIANFSDLKLETLPLLQKQLEQTLSQGILSKDLKQKIKIHSDRLERLRNTLEPKDLDELNSSYRELSKENLEKKIKQERIKVQEFLHQSLYELSNLDKKLGEIDYLLSQEHHQEQKNRAERDLKNLLFELEEGIEAYLIESISYNALSRLASHYQKENQEKVLHLASQYLRQMTLENYTQVGIDLLKEGSFLLCLGKSGWVGVDALSLGTTVQLYLALKLAFIKMQLGFYEPIPILLDDLFVQFDDQRARSGLRLLQEYAQNQQVFFLTHHSHLLDLVEKNLDPSGYEIHTLNRELVQHS